MNIFVFDLLQVKVEDEDEEGSVEEQEKEEEEENLEKALSVERFGDVISDSASPSGDRMGRNYTEKDFECKQSRQPRIRTRIRDMSPELLRKVFYLCTINVPLQIYSAI